MLNVITEFQTFMVGHLEKFCCDDCDSVENCMNLYKAKKLLAEIDSYKSEEFVHLPDRCVTEAQVLLSNLQECTWQRCDCISRF